MFSGIFKILKYVQAFFTIFRISGFSGKNDNDDDRPQVL